MHRDLLLAVLLACSLALAGCTGTAGPGTTVAEPAPTTTPTATATPTPEPTSEPTPGPVVTPGGLDEEAVVDRHAAALSEAGSYTLVEATKFEGENRSAEAAVVGDMFSISQTTKVDLAASRGLATWGLGENATSSVYVDFERERSYQRYSGVDENGTSFTIDGVHPKFGNGSDTAEESPGAVVVERWLSSIDFTVVGVEQVDGRWVTRLEASGVKNHDEVVSLPDTVERAHSTMLLDESGLVREIRHEQTVNVSGSVVNSTLTIEITDVGSTDVSEPAWLDEAKVATNRTTSETTDARGGDEVENGARVSTGSEISD